MDQVVQGASKLAEQAASLAANAKVLAAQAATVPAADAAAAGGHQGTFLSLLTVFVLACFVGYYVVWRVTPALHSPLMAVTNAISSVIIVGALLAAGPVGIGVSKFLGFFAVVLASVNIFGGFIVTQRMLAMFRKKGR
ncbi:MAG: proton-translocating transhydrogenase family protein [Alphaproteobacteria bacterium]